MIVGIRYDHGMRHRGLSPAAAGAQAISVSVFSAGVVVWAGIRGDQSVQLIQQGRRRLPAFAAEISTWLATQLNLPLFIFCVASAAAPESDIRLAPRPGTNMVGLAHSSEVTDAGSAASRGPTLAPSHLAQT